MPTDEAGLHAELQVTKSGIVVGGAPVGTPEFMVGHARDFFAATATRLDGLLPLVTHGEAQLAFRLLSLSQFSSIVFYLRTVPPSITMQFTAEHDAHVDGLVQAIMGGRFTEDDRQAPRTIRAHTLLSLPTKWGGAGLTRAHELAPIAFLAGYTAGAALAQLRPKVSHLAKDVAFAHAQATISMGGAAAVEVARGTSGDLSLLFPADPSTLTTNQDLAPDPVPDDIISKKSSSSERGPRVQSLLTSYAVAYKVAQFKSKTSPHDARDSSVSSFTTQDATNLAIKVQAWGMTGRTFKQAPNRWLTARLHFWRNRIRGEPGLFGGKLRAYVGLPQVITDGAARHQSVWCDTVVAHCPVTVCIARFANTPDKAHRTELDMNGSHASVCPTTKWAVTAVHNDVTTNTG